MKNIFEEKGFSKEWISIGIVVWELRGTERHIHVSNINDADWDEYCAATAPCLVIMYGNDGDGQQTYELTNHPGCSEQQGQEQLSMLLDGLIPQLNTPWID